MAENVDKSATPKCRVGIIMGGLSSEKEVSLESGRNIFSKIDRGKYAPVPIFMDSHALLWEIPLKLLMRNSTRDIEEDLEAEATHIPYESLKERIDVVCLGLHGKYGEDGCMQGLLELLKIPYTGSGVLASAIGMDKYVSRRILTGSGIDVPRTIPVQKKRWETESKDITEDIARNIGFPCVIKPSREGCSTAVKKVVSAEGIPEALENAFLWDSMALVEEFISGTEVTCGVLGSQNPEALIPSETIATEDILSLEDKFLYGQGENKTPPRLPEEQIEKIRETAVAAFQALNLKGYARIDMFLLNDGRVTVLEPNTLPGMTPSTVLFHQAAALGITPANLIDRIIEYAKEVHKDKKGPL
jgi:D-alanine-D-alanine ligase